MANNQHLDNSSEEHFQTILDLLETLDKSNIIGAFQLSENTPNLSIDILSYLFAISLFFPDDFVNEQSRLIVENSLASSSDVYALSYNFDLEYHLDNESKLSDFLTELHFEFNLNSSIVGNTALRLLNTGWMFCLQQQTASADQLQDWIHNRELSLDNLDIEEVPAAVGGLTNLNFLFLELNQLRALPDEISNLKYLKRLYLNDNFFSEFPECICQLEYLRELRLEHNKIETVTPLIGLMTNLEVLHLSYNRLTTLPPEIGQLKKLRRVWLVGNHFSGAEKVKVRKLFSSSTMIEI
ncbi:leucine-rich repeat domain-containing protein [uncultured Microscilla sp.]|uniref:leucine-rich repeat domain-containing protein n=1 Tax=uncultured Microscilla sp. TaxID=432653 RepID=UPI00262EDC63|nr:leucine-rich repeat domain-containing protein [uncultured Microscilla sp.]